MENTSSSAATQHSGSKYIRKIIGAVKILIDNTLVDHIDVYSVILTFKVTCPARQQAIKKLLCSGLRGKGDVLQDLREAGDAIKRAIDIEEQRQPVLESFLVNKARSRAALAESDPDGIYNTGTGTESPPSFGAELIRRYQQSEAAS